MAETFGFKYGETYYEPGTVQFYLPHQCDEWEIGGVEDMRAFIAEAQEVLREATGDDAGGACTAALNIAGKHFPCDMQVLGGGPHDGWPHTNTEAEAMWGCGDE